METTVWVDADSCPVLVRNYLITYTEKLNVRLNFVANKKNITYNRLYEIYLKKELIWDLIVVSLAYQTLENPLYLMH